MTAFFIPRISPRDPEWMAEYAGAAGASIATHGRRSVPRGVAVRTLLDEADDRATGVIAFPYLTAPETWFGSPEYQTLTDLRDAASETQFVVQETPAP